MAWPPRCQLFMQASVLLNSLKVGFDETFLFQSTELEELDDLAKLVLPPPLSTKAVVGKNTDHNIFT